MSHGGWRRWGVALLVLVALAVASCGGGVTKPAAPATALSSAAAAPSATAFDLAADQTLRVNLGGEPSTLDPSRAAFSLELSVIESLFRGPFRFDASLALVADMAREVPTKANKGISDDGLVYTVRLRPGLTWSDGKPIVAKDMAFALRRAVDPRTGGDYRSFLWGIKGARPLATMKPGDAGLDEAVRGVAIETPDDTTVQITLAAPDAAFLNYLALWIAAPLREDVIVAKGTAWTEPGNLISSGPFVLKEWQHQDHITIAPNPAYYGTKATATVRFAMVEDPNQAFNLYRAGQLDEVSVPAALVPTLRADPALGPQVVTQDRLATYRVLMDNRKSPLDNKRVRQALAYAVDRKALVDVALKGVGKPATSLLPPGMPGYDAAAGPAFDRDRARQLLSDAGFANGQGLPHIVLTFASAGSNPALATTLKEQWRQVLGIDVEIEPLDPRAFQERFRAGQVQMTLVSFSTDYPDPGSFLGPMYRSGEGNNKSNYSNPQFDALVAAAGQETDPVKALVSYRQAQQLLQDDSPDIFLFYQQATVLRRPTVRGLQNSAMDFQVLGDRTLEQVKIAR